jgi:hypothetical protein
MGFKQLKNCEALLNTFKNKQLVKNSIKNTIVACGGYVIGYQPGNGAKCKHGG